MITTYGSLDGTAYVISQTDDKGNMIVLDVGGRVFRPNEAKGHTVVELELIVVVEAV